MILLQKLLQYKFTDIWLVIFFYISDEIGIHIAVKHINVDSYIPKPQSSDTPKPGDKSTDPTPRPRSILPNHLLKEYALNKIFFHFLDCLEQQESNWCSSIRGVAICTRWLLHHWGIQKKPFCGCQVHGWCDFKTFTEIGAWRGSLAGAQWYASTSRHTTRTRSCCCRFTCHRILK